MIIITSLKVTKRYNTFMIQNPQLATLFFSSLTIFAQIVSFFIVLSLFMNNIFSKKIKAFFAKRALLCSFLIALVSMLGSLYYSEIAQYTPCTLCWYQRILMYPQVVLLGLSYLRKDSAISVYGMVFSGIGFIIASYHYLLQIGTIEELTPCGVVGYSVSCSENFGMTFGYITIPMMAMSGFLLIFLLLLILHRSKH